MGQQAQTLSRPRAGSRARSAAVAGARSGDRLAQAARYLGILAALGMVAMLYMALIWVLSSLSLAPSLLDDFPLREEFAHKGLLGRGGSAIIGPDGRLLRVWKRARAEGHGEVVRRALEGLPR